MSPYRALGADSRLARFLIWSIYVTTTGALQMIVRVCLFIIASIAIFGGALQMYLGQPDTWTGHAAPQTVATKVSSLIRTASF
jgi:hypothetical protein